MLKMLKAGFVKTLNAVIAEGKTPTEGGGPAAASAAGSSWGTWLCHHCARSSCRAGTHPKALPLRKVLGLEQSPGTLRGHLPPVTTVRSHNSPTARTAAVLAFLLLYFLVSHLSQQVFNTLVCDSPSSRGVNMFYTFCHCSRGSAHVSLSAGIIAPSTCSVHPSSALCTPALLCIPQLCAPQLCST